MRCAATVSIEHPDAERLAASIAPDHTDPIQYSVTDDTLTIMIEQSSIRRLQATCDDTVLNLQMATEILQTTHE